MTISAEDVIHNLHDRISPGLSSPETVAYWTKQAALVRALEAVRVAADAYKVAATQGYSTHDKWVAMKEALAAVDRIRNNSTEEK